MKQQKRNYQLVNHDGCLMGEVEATSFIKARCYFARRYDGNYVIVCGEIDERKNVRL